MKLKVYGGYKALQYQDRPVRVIVATTSWKRASEICNSSLGHIRAFWSITGNREEIRWATANPEQMLVSSESWNGK